MVVAVQGLWSGIKTSEVVDITVEVVVAVRGARELRKDVWGCNNGRKENVNT